MWDNGSTKVEFSDWFAFNLLVPSGTVLIVVVGWFTLVDSWRFGSETTSNLLKLKYKLRLTLKLPQ